jgi:hypothetical protein
VGNGVVVDLQHPENIMDKVEKIAVLDNEVQAELVDSVLSERSVPHIMRSYHDSAYDGIFQTGGGWGEVEAPVSFKAEILNLIADIKRQASSVAASEVPPADH